MFGKYQLNILDKRLKVIRKVEFTLETNSFISIFI